MSRSFSSTELDSELDDIFLTSLESITQSPWLEKYEVATPLQEISSDYADESDYGRLDDTFMGDINMISFSVGPQDCLQTQSLESPFIERNLVSEPNQILSEASCSSSTSQNATSLTTASIGTIAPGTAVGELSAKPDRPLQIIQYRPADIQRKQMSNVNRPTQTRLKDTKRRALTTRSNVLKPDTTPKASIKRDNDGRVVATTAVFGLEQIIRAPVTNESRSATAMTRRIGACERCHRNKLRCDMSENIYEPCARCKKVLYNFYLRSATNYQHQPCMRIDLLDLRLHRKGPMIQNDLPNWVHKKQLLLANQDINDTHTLCLSQGFGSNALYVVVSRFEPLPGDRTTYFWTDLEGNARSMIAPPYFISDVMHARRSIRDFFHNVRSTYIEVLIADTNPLVRETFHAALIYSAFDSSKLVSEALDVWVAARFIESQWRVVGNGEKIGLEPQNEPGHPFCGFTPVTPIMDTQLDDLAIRELLVPFTSRFLKSLKERFDEKKRENWMEIYFALFIMMSNIGWTIRDMITHATWKGLKAGSRGGTLTQGYIHACKTMLAYFHFACAGSYPLSIAWDKSLAGSEKDPSWMTRDQIKYLGSVQQMMNVPGAKIRDWKDLSMYSDDSYWCYQLLCLNWRGDIPHAGEIDDYREEDFLSSSVD